ncbi:MAG: acyl carrier protein [Planctomycetes bacterium]|nr:acyl carrier protein [Planctomycetota bacterium]
MTSRADRRAALRMFLAHTYLLSDAEFPYADDVSLMAEGVVDSTGVLELILFLDERFGVHVDDAEAVPQNLDTVARILDYLDRKLAVAR